MIHRATIRCFSQDSQPVGAVMLIKYDVEQTPELRLYSFAIKKHGAPTLRLAADTEEAAARWTTVIKEAIERNDQVNVACKLDELFRYVCLRKRNLFKEEATDVTSRIMHKHKFDKKFLVFKKFICKKIVSQIFVIKSQRIFDKLKWLIWILQIE